MSEETNEKSIAERWFEEQQAWQQTMREYADSMAKDEQLLNPDRRSNRAMATAVRLLRTACSKMLETAMPYGLSNRFSTTAQMP